MTDVATTPASARDPARASLGIQALLAVLVAFLLAGCFLGAFLLGYKDMLHDLTELLKYVVVAIVSYYFGSSAGSRIKSANAASGQPHG